MPPEGCDIVLGAASLFKVIAALEVIGKMLFAVVVLMAIGLFTHLWRR